MNILIVKLSSLGDVVHTLPALTTLRRHWPAARITWLAEPPAFEILRGHPALDRILVWPRRKWTGLLRAGRLPAAGRLLREFLRELRDTRFDLVVDFQGLAKSALWVAAARAAEKAGYGPGHRRREWAWLACNRRVPVRDPRAHAVERNLQLLEGLGLPRLPLRYDFPILPENEREAAALLAELGLPAGVPFVAASVLTRWPAKNWTPEGFAQTADALALRGLPVVLTGAAEDRAALDAVAAVQRSPVRRLDGRTSLKTLAAVFRRARVVLSTDTGPLHIAVAVGTPVVALFGPTDPGYTGPYGDGHVVLRSAVPCSPCFQKTCRTRLVEPHACMRRLEPSVVADAVARLAAQERPGWKPIPAE